MSPIWLHIGSQATSGLTFWAHFWAHSGLTLGSLSAHSGLNQWWAQQWAQQWAQCVLRKSLDSHENSNWLNGHCVALNQRSTKSTHTGRTSLDHWAHFWAYCWAHCWAHFWAHSWLTLGSTEMSPRMSHVHTRLRNCASNCWLMQNLWTMVRHSSEQRSSLCMSGRASSN